MGYRYITCFNVYGDSLSYFFIIFPGISQNTTKKQSLRLLNLTPGILTSVFPLQLITLLMQTVKTTPVFLPSI